MIPHAMAAKPAKPLVASTSKAGDDNPLNRPLQFTKGVGPKRAELLKRLMLETVNDLLHFFPVSYKDRAHVTSIADLREGDEVNVRAQVIDVKGRRFPGGKERIDALLKDDTGQILACWWNPYVANKLTPYSWGFYSGKVASYNNRPQLSSPEFEILGTEEQGTIGNEQPESPDFGRIVPVYSLRPKKRRPDGTEAPEVKLNQSLLRKLAWEATQSGVPKKLVDELPASIRDLRNLLPRSEAVRSMHFPDTDDVRTEARRRLAYEELFILSIGIALRRMRIDSQKSAWQLKLGPNIKKRIDSRLPFELTAEQSKAFHEIARDMGQPRPMNRLLQGDVGCGKTAVAVAAMLLAVAHGKQAALLAPTEVLAEQHVRTLQRMLEGSRVQIQLLRGATSVRERTEFLEELKSGRTHIAVGTHALLEPGIQFKDLAFIVVDEQHKFGVEQRHALRAKGSHPHVMVMTATPIPRTLSLSLYGDLDVSTIQGFPPGRGQVVTRWLKEEKRSKLHDHLLKEARKGRVAYVVLPRIEGRDPEEEKQGQKGDKSAQKDLWSTLPQTEVKGVEKEVKRLKKCLPTLRVTALHGRMDSGQKDSVLKELREGRIDVLVSTQVIEVGIDLPNATTMVIENAERFGLASLHQLRGRIGRSDQAKRSYCFFFADPTNVDAKNRLKAFEKTKDGFEIAEADFRQRGPGQFFGTEQSGLPEFLVADLLEDRELLEQARGDAFALVRQDPKLQAAEHILLKKRVLSVLGKRLGLIEVG